MLEFCIDKQVITRRDRDVIVANSSDYLEVEFNFSNEWKGLGKTAIFTNTTGSLSVLLNENNQITPDKHLNLSVGTWVVSVYGILGTKRIITNIASMVVVDSGASSGTVPVEPTPDIYEQIMTQYTNLINLLSVDNLADTIVLRDEYGSTELTSVRLDLAPEIATVEGEISWNPTEMTADIKTIDGITMQVGQEFLVPVNNKTANTITDGTLVSWGSTDGNSGNLNVIPYIANGTIENERVIGIATHDIEADTSGLITRQGKLRGLNTTGSTVSETWSSGTILYASPTAAGKLTSVKPSYPNRVTRIGMVITAHATVGTIYIQVTNYPLANQIGVVDAGSYFTATDLETILQEIGSRLPV